MTVVRALFLASVLLILPEASRAQIQPCTNAGQPVGSWACTQPNLPLAGQDFHLRIRQLHLGWHCGVIVRHWQRFISGTVEIYAAHASGCFGIPPLAATLDLPTLRLAAGTYPVRRYGLIAHHPVDTLDPSQYTLLAEDTLVVSGTPPAAVAAPTSSMWALLVMIVAMLLIGTQRFVGRMRHVMPPMHRRK